jgi:hypothetical protein
MPIKVFGSPYLATYVSNNAASFGITEAVESELITYTRGGTLSEYGEDWTTFATWVKGLYTTSDCLANPSTAAAPACIQDDNRFSGCNAPLNYNNNQEMEFGFPNQAGTSGFLPLQSQINYVRFWVLARGFQTRTIGNDQGTGNTACPNACGDTNCYVVPRQWISGSLGAGVLYPHIKPVGNWNLAPTDETVQINASQKFNVSTYFNAIDPRTGNAQKGFPLYFDVADSTRRETENWKLGNAGVVSPNNLADRRYYPNENFVMRTTRYTQNPFGNSGIPWTADYAQWCAYGLKVTTASPGNCEGLIISDFAIEFGYDLSPNVVDSRCGEAQELADGALLKGYYESAGLPVDWRFEYGANSSVLGNFTPFTLFEIGPREVTTLLTGLPSGTYYYRLQLRDAALNLYNGDICSFTTADACQVRSVLVM